MIVGFALLFCYSCHKTQDDNGMLRARILTIKAAGDSVPEQALASLDSLREEVMMSGSMHLERMYELTKIRLRDKADWTFHSDDTITITKLCRYFARYGSPAEQMEAQYYLGRVSREIKNYPQAVEGFLKAIKIGESGAEVELPVLQWAYSQMSGVYTSILNRKGALEMAQKGLDLSKRTGTVDPIYIMDVGNAAIHAGDTTKAMTHYDDAIAMIRQEGSSRHYLDVTGALLVRFSRAGRKADADYCLACLDSLPTRSRPHNYLYGLASYCKQFVSADSAAQVQKQIYETSTTWAKKANAACALMWYYREKGDYKKSNDFAIAMNSARDSVFKERELEQTAIASGEQLYRRSREAEQEAREAATRYKLYMLSAVVAVLFVTLIIFLLYSMRLKAFNKRLMEKDRLLHAEAEAREQAEESLKVHHHEMELKHHEVAVLDERLERTHKKLANKTVKLEKRKTELEEVNRQLEEVRREHDSQIAEMERKDAKIEEQKKQIREMVRGMARIQASQGNIEPIKTILERVKLQAYNDMNEGEWTAFCQAVEDLYPASQANLQLRSKNHSERYRRAYCLWRIGLPNWVIHNLTDVPRQTVSRWIKQMESMLEK